MNWWCVHMFSSGRSGELPVLTVQFFWTELLQRWMLLSMSSKLKGWELKRR